MGVVDSIAEQLVRIATTQTHDRLQARWERVADQSGFKTQADLNLALGQAKEKSFPDVRRQSGPFLLVMDAKNPETEAPTKTDSAERITKYLVAVQSTLALGTLTGALFGIATAREAAAWDWHVFLTAKSPEVGLKIDTPFEVRGSGEDWWVIGGVILP